MELFNNPSQASSKLKPLAERVRPTSFDRFFGQKHILNDKSLIPTMVKGQSLRSLILWGPPGSGKTTLAYVIAQESKLEMFSLNAISSGVQDVRKVIEKGNLQARHYSRQILLFIDEIHRFNKSQQDSLLHAVEHGDIVLIGATTENPSFEVNSPLLSRCQVLKLKALDSDEIRKVIHSAIHEDIILKNMDVQIDEEALDVLVQWANGDARIALNTLESSVEMAEEEGSIVAISKDHVQQATQKKAILYDKKGDFHYDVISAFIKSMRGSDPQAALYYLAIMLEGGEDIEFIGRRMIVLASEDIGNADPQALVLSVSCLTAIQNIGMPEARIILSQTVSYLACAPKSNASYIAIKKAMKTIKEKGYDVPMHLRNAPTKLMKQMGHGKGYQYPHDHEGHFVYESYLPDSIQGEVFYEPGDLGHEKAIKKRLEDLWGP